MKRQEGPVSVIIPTRNPGEQLRPLLEALLCQTRKPDEIIVVDSASEDGTVEVCREFPEVTLLPIPKGEFDHGGTRDMALRKSSGEFVLFLTQDALPAGEDYIAHLLLPFADPLVALVSGRQLPRGDATRREQLVRAFNYPAQSNVRSGEDIPRLGIKAFFASNACSAYRRSAYLEVGGFDRPILAGEDMLLAARLLQGGFKAAYRHQARVIHSHNQTARQQYARNFDLAAAMALRRDLLARVPVVAEGLRMVKFVLGRLLREGRPREGLVFCLECAARWLGYRRGGKYHKLTPRQLLARTANPAFWVEREKSH